jgi:hypothetical protein
MANENKSDTSSEDGGSVLADYDLTWDLNVKKQLEVEYANKPVLVAETVYQYERIFIY